MQPFLLLLHPDCGKQQLVRAARCRLLFGLARRPVIDEPPLLSTTVLS